MKKNILFVIDSLHCGGAEKSLVTLLNNLNYKDYEVDLLLVTRGGAFEKFVPNEVHFLSDDILENFSKHDFFISRAKYWFFRKKYKNKLYHSSQLYWKAFGDKIKKIDKSYDVSIAYGQGLPTYYVAKKTESKKKYSWLNTDHQKTGYNPIFDYRMYNNFNKVVAVSEESKLSLQKAMKAIGESLPIEIIRDIVDKDFIQKMGNEGECLISKNRNHDETKILTVCRLEKVKGLDMAIKACEILHNKGVKFKWYVVGDGSLRSSLQENIEKKGLQDYFVLMGFRENPYSSMKACDIYVQTSLFEGLGMTVIEASFLNKPIVTTNFPTASTIIEHNETGLIAQMNYNSIAENVFKYVEDPELLNKVVVNLSKQKNNDKENSLEKFNNLIQL